MGGSGTLRGPEFGKEDVEVVSRGKSSELKVRNMVVFDLGRFLRNNIRELPTL